MGVGLYETVLVEDHRIRLLDRHLARLADAGVDPAVVAGVERRLLESCAEVTAPTVVRIDVDDRGVRLTPRAPRPGTPVRLLSVAGYDPADGTRTTKRADRSWAAGPERAAGSDEALLVSSDGLVGETTRANVFVVLAGQVVTPPVEGLLPGVTRSWVLEQTGARQRPVARSEVGSAAAVFVTSAGRGVVTVAAVDDRPVHVHPMVDELQQAWRALAG